uniref:MDM2 binding protein n=1 Tax=Salmo trutta TaxID=8032 RepID=A0A673ZPT0_SALTR
MNSCMNKVLIWDDCRLYEEAAEGLHQLSDKLPPPGKALLDVIFLGFAEEAPKLKDFLPVIGSLKHMQTWHSAKMTIVTEHQAGWQKPASNLSARVVDPRSIMTCIDERELWRGGVLIREKKVRLFSALGFHIWFVLQVGALFSLSCTVSSMALPPASQLSSQKWKDFMAKRPKTLPVPYVEVKGESGHYFLLVQGSEGGGCKARMIHSANQINGAAAMATVNGLLRENSVSSSETLTEKTKLLFSHSNVEFIKHSQHADWPERSVLQNYEHLQRTRQKLRFGLLSGGSSDCLLGPKDIQGQRTTPALLDAKELLRHFTPDGLPTGDLQPLLVQRLGGNTFQMSPDLTPRKVTQIPFNQAASSHYHGLEFCLDEQGHKALDRDQGFVRLQSRLIRYETQTTCSKEPCPVPFALSPAPSPAVLSEPGSVPDGEALLNSDLPRIKRRSWDTDTVHPHKRLAKSESSESLGSVCSGSSGTDTHPALRGLRPQKTRSQSSSSVSALRLGPQGSEKPHPDPQNSHRAPQAQGHRQGQAEDKASKESRSQKHARMLKEVVAKTLKHHGITREHKYLAACSQRLFEISKFYLKDLKTSRGLHEEMMKAASSNAKQVIDWVTEKASK